MSANMEPGLARLRSVLAGWLAVAVLMVVSSGAANAQIAGAGTITGTLMDASRAVVPDASVMIHNVETGVDRTVTTNGAGIYVAPFLQPGHYEVTASKAGFATLVRKDLDLQVGQTMTIDFQMPVQSTQETVTVTAAGALLDTEKTELSQVVSTAQVANLPLAGRRWESFAFLSPNVTADGGTGLVSYRGISGLYNRRPSMAPTTIRHSSRKPRAEPPSLMCTAWIPSSSSR